MPGRTLKVRTPLGNGYNNPSAMVRVDEHIGDLGAFFVCSLPSNLPGRDKDGNWTVEIIDNSQTGIIKGILRVHYGLEIVSETE